MTRKIEWLPSTVPQWIQKKVAVHDLKLNEFVEQIGRSLENHTWVLDAGSGEGRHKAEFTHTHCVGIDKALGDPNWDYSNLDVIGDLFKLPFEENKFDAVLCIQVLEHIPEPGLVLEEINRVMKPGGQIFLTVPQSWHQHQKPYDFYRYTSFGMRYLLEKTNFDVESIEPMGGYFWYLSFQLQMINYWLFPRGMSRRKWTLPLRFVFSLIFQLVLPLILFYLDPLDRIKDETFGYLCVAVKPSEIQ